MNRCIKERLADALRGDLPDGIDHRQTYLDALTEIQRLQVRLGVHERLLGYVEGFTRELGTDAGEHLLSPLRSRVVATRNDLRRLDPGKGCGGC